MPIRRNLAFSVALFLTVLLAVAALFLAAEIFARWQRARMLDRRMDVVENLVRTNAAYNKALFPGYAGREEEASRYFKEIAEAGSIHRPYIEYRRLPNMHKAGWNTNSLGYRGPEFDIRKPQGTYRVLLYGGSFVWGTGALADEETIAGHLQRILNEKPPPGTRFEVINCGESNYQSTQEAVFLLVEGVLLSPDLVVFLDGVNDTQKGADGLPAGYTIAFDSFNRLLTGAARQKAGFTIDNEREYLKRQRALVWSASGSELLDRAATLFQEDRLKPGDQLSSEITSPEEIALRQSVNMRSAEALGKEFGFRTAFVIQPIPILHKPLHEEERKAVEALRETDTYYGVFAWWERFYDAYGDQVMGYATTKDLPVLDLRRVFEKETQPLYIDFCHVTGEGYRIVAGALADWLAVQNLLTPESSGGG
jgi:lysophospholipase L1-like esterase